MSFARQSSHSHSSRLPSFTPPRLSPWYLSSLRRLLFSPYFLPPALPHLLQPSTPPNPLQPPHPLHLTALPHPLHPSTAPHPLHPTAPPHPIHPSFFPAQPLTGGIAFSGQSTRFRYVRLSRANVTFQGVRSQTPSRYPHPISI